LIIVNAMELDGAAPPPATVSVAEAARRLGVKPATLYAYVSRGLLQRVPAADGRGSAYDRLEIEALAARGRPRRSSRSSSIDLLIETRVTSVDAAGHRYRGHPASELARAQPFECVAELLWSGTLPRWAGPWQGTPAPRGEVGLAQALRLAVAHVAARERSAPPTEVVAAGRHLIATVVDSLAPCAARRVPRLAMPGAAPLPRTVAGRLWAQLAPRAPADGMLAALNAALVLLADHDVAASTFAVRVAASTRAGTYACVAAGMAVLSGPLHGGASGVVRELLREGGRAGAGRAVAARVASSPRSPGFGHPLYPGGDPRAAALVSLVRAAAPHARPVAVYDEVVAAVARATGLAPNVDAALALLAEVADMDDAAGEVVFAVARTAGWLAHVAEEYGEEPLRFRPRATYVGP